MSWKRTPGPMTLAALLALMVGTFASAAQEAPRLRIDMRVEKEVSVTGPGGDVKLQREPVEAAAAGDVLVYTLAIVNEGDGDAHRARVVDPVPGGTVLIPGSAEGAGARVTYSADGGASFAGFPLTRPAVGPDGIERLQPVPLEEYTHVRWILTEPLAPGQVRTANFKVRVQ